MSAGYSKRPLYKKLGIKEGMQLAFINAPEVYAHVLGSLPAGVGQSTEIGHKLDFVQFFTRSRSDLAEQFPVLKAAIKKNGMLWISWPKKASKVPTDVDENIVRTTGLEHGLVDVKVCAVDAIWSGLKFVYRVEDR